MRLHTESGTPDTVALAPAPMAGSFAGNRTDGSAPARGTVGNRAEGALRGVDAVGDGLRGEAALLGGLGVRARVVLLSVLGSDLLAGDAVLVPALLLPVGRLGIVLGGLVPVVDVLVVLAAPAEVGLPETVTEDRGSDSPPQAPRAATTTRESTGRA
ncbi:hypothetical protein [Pedococcus sp. 5OH_020]|uniref:hypothetical protein n=1 Tax=Pedococcus sp. 5OH_020 TaxID=2989814 RepID=UPI0022E9F13E|nr:hypothetical protein [Pedococcus sp. 5OH_020]